MRSSVAASVVNHTSGKNPDLTLFAVDGFTGTLDPAFMAHVNPIMFWALASWEAWFNADTHASTFTAAASRLASAKGSRWSCTIGPVTALLATAERLGWCMPSATEIVDDLGNSWNFLMDSPAAIAKACRSAVRRWRSLRVASAVQGLLPASSDVQANGTTSTEVVVDFILPVQPFLRGKRPKAAQPFGWEGKFAAPLQSAMIGGQWTGQESPG